MASPRRGHQAPGRYQSAGADGHARARAAAVAHHQEIAGQEADVHPDQPGAEASVGEDHDVAAAVLALARRVDAVDVVDGVVDDLAIRR
jgi:hypothetical protein